MVLIILNNRNKENPDHTTELTFEIIYIWFQVDFAQDRVAF